MKSRPGIAGGLEDGREGLEREEIASCLFPIIRCTFFVKFQCENNTAGKNEQIRHKSIIMLNF